MTGAGRLDHVTHGLLLGAIHARLIQVATKPGLMVTGSIQLNESHRDTDGTDATHHLGVTTQGRLILSDGGSGVSLSADSTGGDSGDSDEGVAESLVHVVGGDVLYSYRITLMVVRVNRYFYSTVGRSRTVLDLMATNFSVAPPSHDRVANWGNVRENRN